MNGVLPVDKPAGPTSHDVVAIARRSLGIRRIGHTGTLDPFATGLLLLCVGPSTRLAEYLTGMDKRYEGVARLGVRTDTLDGTGEVVSETDDWAGLDEDAIREAFLAEVGTRLQQPPAYSAKKIAGRRSYERARQGEAVLPDPVEVTIRALEVVRIAGRDVQFSMECSSGTYVRAVARDAGERLGVGAHLIGLRRTAIGGHTVDDAIPLDRLDDADAVAAALIPPLRALDHLPAVQVDDAAVRRIGNGQAIPAPSGLPEAGLVALSSGTELVALAERDEDVLRPRKVFT